MIGLNILFYLALMVYIVLTVLSFVFSANYALVDVSFRLAVLFGLASLIEGLRAGRE